MLFLFICGDVERRGCVRCGGVFGVGFVDWSYECFYVLCVRCGKKEKNLVVKVVKV